MFSSKINSHRNKLVTLGFFLLFIALPASKGLSNFAEFMILALSLDRIFKPSVSYKTLIRKNTHVLTFCLFYVMVIAGLIWSDDMHAGLKIVRHYHRWLVIPLLFLVNWEVIKHNVPLLLLTSTLTAGLAASITIIFQWLGTETARKLSETIPLLQAFPKSGNNAYFGLYSPFMDRLQFSNLLGLNALILLYLVFTKKYRPVILLTLVPIVYCMIILGGRGGQISFFIGFLFYLGIYATNFIIPVLTKKAGKFGAWSLVMLFFSVLSVGIPFFILKANESAKKRYDQLAWELTAFFDGSYHQYDYVHFTSVRRIVSYQHMTRVALDHPIIGVGTGDLVPELQHVYDQDKYKFPVNIHSQFLYIFGSWGIIGLSIFVVAWWKWLKGIRHDRPTFYFGLTITVFYLLGMMSDPVLNKQIDLIAFLVLICTLGLLAKEKSTVTEASTENNS